jgi:two-component system sensor histidine kinase LytS
MELAMDFLQADLMQHWLDYTLQLLQRFSMLVVVAFSLMRREWLRKALLEKNLTTLTTLSVMAVFGAIAIIGTYSSVVIDLHKLPQSSAQTSHLSSDLKNSQALVGFRDTMTLMAGLIGGPLVGFGTGLIAGVHRYSLGGFAGLASGLGTLLLGIFAGYAQRLFPRETATAQGVLCVAFIGSILQRVVILLVVDSPVDANVLSWEIAVPIVIINCLGCLLFFWIMSDLDKDRLQNQARTAILVAEQASVENKRLDLLARAAQFNANIYKQQAELRALHAQVEPHFLNNTLAAIQALITVNPDNARAYIAKLATFFNETRASASLTSITLEQELMQVQHYMEFQQLRFQEKVVFVIKVPTDLFDYELPPRSLQTLVENALTHGRRGLTHPLEITISGEETANTVMLRVQDNGCGIDPERLVLLGKQIVPSSSNGTALHQLKQSLLLAFREQAKLTVQSAPQQGTTIIIEFPKVLSTW